MNARTDKRPLYMTTNLGENLCFGDLGVAFHEAGVGVGAECGNVPPKRSVLLEVHMSIIARKYVRICVANETRFW